jgi:hypothetical protein
MQQPIMSQSTKRWIFRTIHFVFGIPIIGYIYSPFDKIPGYANPTRYFFVPMLVLSGLWMWKGHVVQRFFSKRSVQQDAAVNP